MAENLSDTTKRIARTVLFLTGLLSTFFMAFAYMKFVWKYPCALIVSGLPGYILFISMIIIMSILALILYEMFFNKNPNGTRKALLSRKTNRLVWALLLLVIVIGFVLPIGLTFSVVSARFHCSNSQNYLHRLSSRTPSRSWRRRRRNASRRTTRRTRRPR